MSTALVGADWRTGRWRAGAALFHSWGSGAYEGDDNVAGAVSSTMTGVFPCGRYGLTPRLGSGPWPAGWGALTLAPDDTAMEYRPGAALAMGAVGLDGLLVDGGAASISVTTTEEVEGLQSSDDSISRRRLGLTATRPFPLATGAFLRPALEMGIRQDSGDAETGFGADLGASIIWDDPERGIRGELRGRTLLTHIDEEFRKQGVAVSFAWQPNPSNRGPSLSLSHALGASADGGMDALLNPPPWRSGMGQPATGSGLTHTWPTASLPTTDDLPMADCRDFPHGINGAVAGALHLRAVGNDLGCVVDPRFLQHPADNPPTGHGIGVEGDWGHGPWGGGFQGGHAFMEGSAIGVLSPRRTQWEMDQS